MVSNNYNIQDNIRSIKEMDDATSKEIQEFIVNDNNFINKYMSNKDSEIFKKINFHYSISQLNKLTGENDIWNFNFKSIKKVAEFNSCNLSESYCLY